MCPIGFLKGNSSVLCWLENIQLYSRKMEVFIFIWAIAFLMTAGYSVQTIWSFKKLNSEFSDREAVWSKSYDAQRIEIARLEEFAVIDPITQFLNTKGFQILVYKEQSRLLLGQELVFCVIQIHCVMQIDFELVSSANVTQGIVVAAEVLRDQFPPFYGIGHLGGGTFAVVIPPGLTDPMDESQIAHIKNSVSDTLRFLTGIETLTFIGIGHSLQHAWDALNRDIGTQ
jgi:GGDEF domain-containing protein